MAQNTSTAVMQRRSEPSDSLDDFPTPPWATRALIEHVLLPRTYGRAKMLAMSTAWDPACNRGYMARPLGEYFADVQATDIHDYGYEHHLRTVDFLWRGSEDYLTPDWLITNPPFQLAEQFIERAFDLNIEGFAMLMRTSFQEGVGRYNRLFSRFAPTITAQFSERVIMHKGKIVNPNVPVPVWSKKLKKWVMRKPSSATSYMWFVWLDGRKVNTSSDQIWIPPCRQQLERPGDYDPIGGAA